MDLTPRQNLCLNMGREAGLYNGAAICLRGIMGEMAGIGGASSTNQGKLSKKDLKHRLSLLNAISHHFYVVFCALHERKTKLPERQIELTERELQIIRLMAAAKSDGVISDILSISPSGVNFHVRGILRKFGVSNRITAVMKAVHSGIVGPDEAVFLRKS
jgi:DNA-binding CsgD family transcriptional regulator